MFRTRDVCRNAGCGLVFFGRGGMGRFQPRVWNSVVGFILPQTIQPSEVKTRRDKRQVQSGRVEGKGEVRMDCPAGIAQAGTHGESEGTLGR